MNEKDKYVEKLKDQINKWSAEIDKLEAKIADFSDDVKAEYSEQIKTLRVHGNKAKAKLLEIQDASGDVWEELKKAVEVIWSSLKDGFEKLKNKLK